MSFEQTPVAIETAAPSTARLVVNYVAGFAVGYVGAMLVSMALSAAFRAVERRL